MKGLHTDILGIIAGICTSASFIPQIIKIFRTKHVRDISMWMYLVFSLGVLMWLIYGIILGEFPIILANLTAFICCSLVIWAKVVFGRENKK